MTKQSKEVATKSETILASLPGIPKEIIERTQEVAENVQSMGEDFSLQKIKSTTEGFEINEGEEPLEKIEAIIIMNRQLNTYYANPYNPKDIQPPDCFSLDCKVPDPSSKSPQNATCSGCKQAEYGTNSMKSGKACRNTQPLYILRKQADMEGEFPYSTIPRVLTVTPTSLKSIRKFLMDVTERGIAYWKVTTEISYTKGSKDDKYVTLNFKVKDKLKADQIAGVEHLRGFWQKWTQTASLDKQGVAEQEETPNQAPPTGGPKEF